MSDMIALPPVTLTDFLALPPAQLQSYAALGPVVILGSVDDESDKATVAELNDHINDTTPHPAYDDIASLVILFENGIA